jgi:hypothetical protein
MVNRHRGEIEADIGGARRRLVLTLGALAELEDAFGADDLVALTERFGSGRMKARDLTRIIGAGLRGAGETLSDADVAAMAIEGGAQGYVRIAAELIAATFGEAEV